MLTYLIYSGLDKKYDKPNFITKVLISPVNPSRSTDYTEYWTFPAPDTSFVVQRLEALYPKFNRKFRKQKFIPLDPFHRIQYIVHCRFPAPETSYCRSYLS